MRNAAARAPRSLGSCERRRRCRNLALGHSNNPAGTSTTRRPVLAADHEPQRHEVPVLHHEQIARGVGLDRDHRPVPGPVDLDDLAADEIVHEERLRVLDRGRHEQRTAELVGRLPGVNALELDQVSPLKRPGAAHFELADT